MLNNNLSNRQAPRMLFRVDGFLVKHKETNLLNKLIDKFSPYKRVAIQEEVSQALYKTFRNTDYSCGLVVLLSEWTQYSPSIRDTLIDLPIGDIHIVGYPIEITSKLHSGEYSFYVDNDQQNISLVNHSRCISLGSYNRLIAKGYKYE